MREMVVFSGSAHRQLAKDICDRVGVPLSPTSVQRYSNDCLQVQLGANCRQRDVYVIQPLVPPTQESLMELLLMLDAARGASAGQITAVIPHYAYARSDKKDASRISIGGRLVADLIVAAGATRVITMALHAPQVHGFFSVPVDHLTAIGVLAQYFRSRDLTSTVVVSPDLGNAKTATQFARLLGVPVAAGSKRRLADDRVVIDAIVGEVSGKCQPGSLCGVHPGSDHQERQCRSDLPDNGTAVAERHDKQGKRHDCQTAELHHRAEPDVRNALPAQHRTVMVGFVPDQCPQRSEQQGQRNHRRDNPGMQPEFDDHDTVERAGEHDGAHPDRNLEQGQTQQA